MGKGQTNSLSLEPQAFARANAKYTHVIFEDVSPSNWAGEGRLHEPRPVKS